MIYFTSDLHLCHNSELIYKRRGYSSMAEHDAAVVRNWNSVVEADDTVYVLGDIIFGQGINEDIRKLKGEIHFLIGNHDTDRKISQCLDAGWICEGYATMLEINGYRYFLSHYPADVMNFGRKEITCLCGHKHVSNPFADLGIGAYHVELEAHNNRPVSIEDIQAVDVN